MHDDPILSVSALTSAIRDRLENAFPFVWVRGQVANLSRPASGHLYFSLRDEDCSLAVVWFKGNQRAAERFDPLTGEVYEEGPRESLAHSLENGREIVCAGRIAVYAGRGVYQLVVELAQDAGAGRLHEEFERLRAKLAGRGYFSAERKRTLPLHPARIAVITSPGGAAIHDFLRLAQGRGLGASIRIHPVPVQGEHAPGKITAALQRVNAEGWADVIVLIRGGGSLEDLWAFNDEALAGAIFSSAIPVLAGIGHEVDITLADLTADVRAATPSHAAQLLWPGRDELSRRWRVLAEALEQAGDAALYRAENRLNYLTKAVDWRSPLRLLAGWGERLRAAAQLLRSATGRQMERREARLQPMSAGLDAARHAVPVASADLLALKRSLDTAAVRNFERTAHNLERVRLRLRALDPLAPLERGYALARKADGTFVKNTADAVPGERLRLMVRDGDIAVRVEGED